MYSEATAASNYFTWVDDNSWAAEDVSNTVKFTLSMPLATSRVVIVVDNIQTFLQLWGSIGGVLGLLFAIFLLGMWYVERTSDSQDPVGRLSARVLAFIAHKRQALMEKWYPEPDSWTMENIGRMQRKEEKREGGARKVEDAAVSNFKDLYARNAVLSGPNAAEDHIDYGNEVDDFHGQL